MTAVTRGSILVVALVALSPARLGWTAEGSAARWLPERCREALEAAPDGSAAAEALWNVHYRRGHVAIQMLRVV
jgi:hypothetical protein